MPAKNQDKVRLSLDLTPEAKDNLEKVRIKSRVATVVEVFRKALALLELVLDHQAKGGKVILENANGTKERLSLL